MKIQIKAPRLSPTGRPFAYARVLGAAPQSSKYNHGVIAKLAEFVEAFGHPESCVVKGSKVFFWNFVHELGGDQYHTCRCRIPAGIPPSGKLTVEVQTSVRGGGRFFFWFVDRHLAVNATIEPPLFSIGNGPVFEMNRLQV